jgi:hypothetical protein
VDHPGLLEYSCDLHTNIMPVASLKVELPVRQDSSSNGSKKQQQQCNGEVLDSLLKGRPLITLAFSDMMVSVGGEGKGKKWNYAWCQSLQGK